MYMFYIPFSLECINYAVTLKYTQKIIFLSPQFKILNIKDTITLHGGLFFVII